MNKIIRLTALPLLFFICGSNTSCSIANKEVALITDVGDIDDGSFNQASWEAIKEYCIENNKTYDYYRPFADSDFARRSAVKQAVFKGAKIVICPGFKFAPTVAECQKEYPDIKFLLIDDATRLADYSPVDTQNNTVCAGYKCEISGYLAGYAVAQDYMSYDINHGGILDKYIYGYCGGMGTDGVLQFGFGWIEGLVHGTVDFLEEKGIKDKKPEIEVAYNYAGVFAQSDDAAATVKGWYERGAKAVFPCGGKLYQSITEAVKDYNRKKGIEFEEGKAPRNAARWIGVDSDQYVGLRDEDEKKTIITSALKGLDPTIKSVLDFHFNGKFDGKTIGGPYNTQDDKQWHLGLSSKLGHELEDEIEAKDYVGIPTATIEGSNIMRGFNNWTIEQYNELTKKIGESEELIVYPTDGLDIYTTSTPGDKNYYYLTKDDKGNDIPDQSYKGNPSFMQTLNNSKEAFYEEIDETGEAKRVTFKERFLKGYDKLTIMYQ